MLVVVLVAVAAVLALVGANSVANSTAGEAVEIDGRPVVKLPPTDNVALAVVDDDERLASLAIVTLLPGGVGGSIVTVPVNADVNVGLEATAMPLDTLLDVADPAAFFENVENTLGVSLLFGEIVDAERLATLIEPAAPVAVDLPGPVVDGPLGDSDVVVEAGPDELDAATAAAAIAAIDGSGDSYDHHWIDVDMWSAVAAGSGSEAVEPGPVDTVEDLFEQLWSGPVQVRDLALQDDLATVDVDADADAVVLSRRDTVVVFAQVSPTRVSAPGDGLIFRVVVPFSDEQLDAGDGQFDSRSEVARTVVGEMLFFQNNVVSVDTTAAADGAPSITKIEVADERLVDELQASAFVIYGDAEAVLASEVIDGIDAVVTLGTSYLDHKATSTADEPTAEGDVADTVVDDG